MATSGTVYLLHFDRPYGHAGRYTGWTTDLPARLADHASGRGARLMAVITSAGIGFTLARTWPGTRSLERALKRQGGASRRCPLCGVTPAPATGAATAAATNRAARGSTPFRPTPERDSSDGRKPR
ncbi:hypothetical protein GCM10009687_25430 [Asanoa iriomotensis]|uniref:Endonuclease n=1 Tax=Asanoa iriomotensis TaxID=234613 RepID=A0ABQ4CFJ5_9ACTN|nr:hypothetical protein Air01nite_76270 [Asanoa iriomotensis]